MERKDLLGGNLTALPKIMKGPGIRPIKKNELFKKFRPYVPSEYHSLDLYQPPSEDEMAQFRAHADAKKQLNVEAKRTAEEARKRKRDEEEQKTAVV